MYSNLSIAVAQEHQSDLRREADAAKRVRANTAGRPAGRARWFAGISLAWSVRRPAQGITVRTTEPASMGR
jgi:hypothetical protein